MARKMKAVQPPKKNDNVISITLGLLHLATGHRSFIRGGRHADKRRPARVNSKRLED